MTNQQTQDWTNLCRNRKPWQAHTRSVASQQSIKLGEPKLVQCDRVRKTRPGTIFSAHKHRKTESRRRTARKFDEETVVRELRAVVTVRVMSRLNKRNVAAKIKSNKRKVNQPYKQTCTAWKRSCNRLGQELSSEEQSWTFGWTSWLFGLSALSFVS